MLKKIIICCLALLVLSGCGAFNNNNNDLHPDDAVQKVKGNGCVQGVLIDGLTMEPIPVKSEENPEDGIHVLAKNKMIKAKTTKLAVEHLKGEFTICGIPLDNEYPIFATYKGFQMFEGTIKIDSTIAASSTNSHWDVPRRSPILVGNIKLYQIKELAKDYIVRVDHNGGSLEGASVYLKPSGEGYGLDDTDTIPNDPIRYPVLSGVTDESGNATFAAADLAWGANYEYYVRPPDGGALVEAKSGDTYVGLSTSQQDPYLLSISLDLVDVDLAVISTSTGTNDTSANGSISYIFNRDIEILPGTEKTIYASLTYANDAIIAVDDASNEDSEQVAITVKGPKLTLKPIFKTKPDISKEPAITVTMTGISVRPVAGQQLTDIIALSPTVTLFGGPTPVLTSITIISGNNQDNIASKLLPDALVVEAKDQFGSTMSGVSVIFTPSGNGAVGTGTVVTDSDGRASTTWTLPSTGTSATVDVLVGATSYASFDGTISTAVLTTIAIISGDGQSKGVGADLDDPIVFETRDQFSNPMNTVNVDFVLTGTGTAPQLGGQVSGNTVATNGVGRYSGAWRMSGTASANTCVLTGSGTAVTVTFNATAL
jgi:hypothetical protein